MTREATLDDIPEILRLSHRVHSETHYRDIPLHTQKYTSGLRMMIASKQHIVIVAEQNEMVGFLLGVTQEHFFSGEKFATDLLIYAIPETPGVGTRLIARFLQWAREERKVSQIILGISSDIVDEERLGRFYEKQGLKRMGGLYIETRQETGR